MIYTFEGLEGSGKSSSSRRFARRSGLEVYDDPSRHVPSARSRTDEDWMKFGNQANLDVASFSRIADFVVDRWCLSSMTHDFIRGAYAGDDFYRSIAEETRGRARVYLLDVEPDVALARATRVGERGLEIEGMIRRRNRYLEAAKLWRSWGGDVTVIQDGSEDSRDDEIGSAVSREGREFADLMGRQRAFNEEFFSSLGLNLSDLSLEERTRWTKEFVLHLEGELHELLRETHWKMHRRVEGDLSRENLREEWVDAVKFLMGIANVWGFSADELVSEFYRKSAIVESRFRCR